MASISIDSARLHFANKDELGSNQKVQKGLKVLVLGGFSGCGTVSGLLSKRKQYRIDKDNFDEVFRDLKVSLQLPFMEQSICFNDLDDLHPDHLYENISLFNRYKSFKRKLKSPQQFNEVVDSLIAHGLIKPKTSVVESNQAESGGALLDSLLQTSSSALNEASIQNIIRQTIAPYVEPKEHPQTQELSDAIDSAMNDLMRQLMHASDFQNLESSWRSVDLLNRRLDTDRDCQLFIMDVDPSEILSDVESPGKCINETALYQNLIASNSTAGGRPFDAVIVDFTLSNAKDMQSITAVCKIFEHTNTRILTGLSLDSFDHLTNERNPDSQFWNELRAQAFSKNLYLASPNFMLRLPYGRKTAQIDSFKYEELPATQQHRYYLWGNSAYLLLISFFNDNRNPGIVDRLPIHVFSDAGETFVTPSSERYLCSREVTDMESNGCSVVQSVKGSDQVLITKVHPISL